MKREYHIYLFCMLFLLGACSGQPQEVGRVGGRGKSRVREKWKTRTMENPYHGKPVPESNCF